MSWWQCILGGLLLLSCSGEQNNESIEPSTDDPPSAEVSAPILFKESTEGYRSFRIPAIAVSKSGTLLAFAEGRKNSGADEGDINLVLRRSVDKGKTWSHLILVWDDADNTCGNPSPVVDPITGRIHLLMTWNLGDDTIGKINAGTSKDTRRVFYTYSDDDGMSWNKSREITSSAKDPKWGWYATGPCHGIILSKEPYKGRIVIPCDCIEVGAGRKQYSHIIYSDNNGKDWKIGGTSVGGNESTVAELSDGRLILNMRNSSNYRTIAYSSDGGETWTNSEQIYTLIDPVCQGSMLNTMVENKHTLFFSNAASSTRINMSIKKSIDNGKTWPVGYVVHSGPSAYSDIVVLPDNEIGILYENGNSKPYERISFEKIRITKIQ